MPKQRSKKKKLPDGKDVDSFMDNQHKQIAEHLDVMANAIADEFKDLHIYANFHPYHVRNMIKNAALLGLMRHTRITVHRFGDVPYSYGLSQNGY